MAVREEVVDRCETKGKQGYPHSTWGYSDGTIVMQIEGLGGLGGNVIRIGIASWFSHGRKTAWLLQRIDVELVRHEVSVRGPWGVWAEWSDWKSFGL